MTKSNIPCYRILATPNVERANGVTEVTFRCPYENKQFKLFLDDGHALSTDGMGRLIERALSVCHQCRQFRPAFDNENSSNTEPS